MISPETALTHLLKRVALAPNNRLINEASAKFHLNFPNGFPFAQTRFAPELTQTILLARARVLRMEDPPEKLQSLMQRLMECLYQALQINQVLSSHLKSIMGNTPLEYSRVDSFIAVASFSEDTKVSFSDLYLLLGSSWGGKRGNNIYTANLDHLHAIKAFYSLITTYVLLNAGTQSKLWDESRLSETTFSFASALSDVRSEGITPPSIKDLEEIKKTGQTLYLPVGYCNSNVFFFSILAISYSSDAYTLRLLTADGSYILAAGSKQDHYCPEVIWEGLQIDQLVQKDLWKPLLEAAALTESEQNAIGIRKLDFHYLAFNSTHLVPWLVKKLGVEPRVRYCEMPSDCWANHLRNRYFNSKNIIQQFTDAPADDNQRNLLLKPAGKEIKRSSIAGEMRKFVDLIPLDLLHSPKDILLFKSESRLLVLTSAYMTLLREESAPPIRGPFLRMIHQSWGKITGPVEKLMELNPSEEQRKAARHILASVLDLKHRLNNLGRFKECVQLTVPRQLYHSTHTVHRLKLSLVSHQPIKHRLLDSLRLNHGMQPLPFYEKWTAERFAENYDYVSIWYDLLLDAKRKCEPAEICVLAHRNVFSKLPIPSSDNVKDLFPDFISEGFLVGMLILLKKISSLVSSEVYSEALIPPIFVVDMARVYRFSVELYRQLNPAVSALPVSWFCLYTYLGSRHSSHIPGEIKTALEAVAASFKKISPKGHLQPSKEFQEIPLFYMSWNTLPLHYKFHRKSLGPKRYEARSVDEVLSAAELAGSVGLKPEEVVNPNFASAALWENSFEGQCVLTIKEIAQYHIMSTFATTQAYQATLANKDYRDYHIFGRLGPEDHFQLEPPLAYEGFERHQNSFGGNDTKYGKQVMSNQTPMTHRMVNLKDKQIRAPIAELPVTGVEEWREQADLIKALPKRTNFKGVYYLHQAASGPSSFSLDILLEYFEARPALLFNPDYRSYFWSLFASAHILETACAQEPLLLDRLYSLIHSLSCEDLHNLEASNLNFERMLWLTVLARHLCRLGKNQEERFGPLLGKMLQDLGKFAYGKSSEARLAPHLLASQLFLPREMKIPIAGLARLHLLMGRCPPIEPNDLLVWTEACESMQIRAPEIQEALVSGDEAVRRAIWSLILETESEVEKALSRKSQRLSLAALAKTSAQLEKLQLKLAYLQRLSSWWKKMSWRVEPWEGSAAEILLVQVKEGVKAAALSVNEEASPLIGITEELFLCTKTSLVIQIGGRTLNVDWETGRITGEMNLSVLKVGPSSVKGMRLPVHIRKHPDLAPLEDLLRHSHAIRSEEGLVYFQEIPALSLDVGTGAARLSCGGHSYRLVAPSQARSIELPEQLNEYFSVWVSESASEGEDVHGIIAAHSLGGAPHPCFTIDREGAIHPLFGNTGLQLASAGYYPEAQLFVRWGIEQKHILVWLDSLNNVAELHLPLNNGEGCFTRVIRTEQGRWKIDGLDVELESTHEAVPAFAGYPVYLAAVNPQGQRLLLLPGATPYSIEERLRRGNFEIDWNQLIASGPKEGIHQFRIMPSGQPEGLTAADNMLLMLWKTYMGHYSAAVDLAKRWLNPPGRPYTSQEEKILSAWVSLNIGYPPMHSERYPSALSLRLYVIVRIARHLRNYPSLRKDGKSMSKFAKSIIGERQDSYKISDDIKNHLVEKDTLYRQMRGTVFEELMTAYDHEAVLRLLKDNERDLGSAVGRRLYQRLSKIESDHQAGSTEVAFDISGREIYFENDQFGKWRFDNVIKAYPTMAQTGIVPIETIYKSIVPADLTRFFDKAYTLIKSGPQNPSEELEYKAILHGIQELRGGKLSDLCIQYLWEPLGYIHEDVFEDNLMLWLLLEQAYLAKEAGKTLPEIPSIRLRFGLVLQESREIAMEFFNTLAGFSGMEPGKLMQSYMNAWFDSRYLRYLKQSTVNINPSGSFYHSLKSTWSSQLTSEIKRWSRLTAPEQANDSNETIISLAGWNYPVPGEWKDLPFPLLEDKLQSMLECLLQEKIKRQNDLLMLANALPNEENRRLQEFARQIHYAEPLSIDECIALALAGESKLQLPAIFYLEVSVEAAHLQRALTQFLHCKSSQEEEEVRKFFDELYTPHRYLPGTDTLPLMITEYYSDCRLRVKPDQAHLADVLTADTVSNKGSVIQAIMGSGKSKMLAPIWLQVMLNKGRIPILCVPGSLFRTTLSDLQEMMWKRFHTHVRAFTFDRESCTSDSLHSLAETLYIGRLEPTVFVCATRDLHALQLMLKERHQVIEDMRDRLKRFTLEWSRSCMSEEEQTLFKTALLEDDWLAAFNAVPEKFAEQLTLWFSSRSRLEQELVPLMEESELLQSILNLLQHQAALLVDEVATSFDPRNLLSFPIGWQMPANPQAASIGCKLYFEWLAPHYETLGLMNNMQSLSKEKTRQQIYCEIAKTAWVEYRELLPDIPSLELFTAFMLSDCEKGQVMQAFVCSLNESKSVIAKQIAQELAYLKYCLSAGLEGALTMTGHVNYGRSKQDTGLYLAIPYQCANVPKENTLFRRPWKTVLMTCQYYSQNWNDPGQTAELIGFLQGIDPASKDQSILMAAISVWGRRFSDADLSSGDEMQLLTDELNRARLLPEKAQAARLLIRSYLQFCVFPTQLKLDPAQLTSSPQDIPMMAAKADAMGGTFGFEMTWNPKLVRQPDHSSDASILKALAEPRNQTCHIIPKGGVESLFAHFERGALNGYMALIDAGALFKGLSNESVAIRLLTALRQDFDCILFYDEQPSGGARLAIMSRTGKTTLESSDKDGVRRALVQMKLCKPFTFYDQARRIGADLELRNGRALVTFSDNVTQDDLLQSAMRCRGLLTGRHSVAYAIPEEMEGEWTGSEVVETSAIQQRQAEAKTCFHGICEQLCGEARAKIDTAMRSAASFEKRHQIAKASGPFLMENQDNDLVVTFGSLQGMVSSQFALERLVDHLVSRIETILPEAGLTLKASLQAILQWHRDRGTPLPDLVREGAVQDDAVQEVDLSKDQDRLRLMEEEYERMLGTRNPNKEVPWSRFDLRSIKGSPLGSLPDGEGMPALYSLKNALKERGFSVPFSPNLLISANLLTTFLGEANCLLTANQKPVHRVLFVRGYEGGRLVLVSEGDARYLKEHLCNMQDRQGQCIYLLEPSGAINQRGWQGEKITNLWKEGTGQARVLLLQVLIFQGSALILDKLPINEVVSAFQEWTKKDPKRLGAARILFESAIDFRPDDMLHYRRSQKLRSLFTNVRFMAVSAGEGSPSVPAWRR